MSRPDFISIGPPKTGTTWLFEILKDHPGIWLPPVKEVQFFWGFGKRNNLPANPFRRWIRQLLGYSNKKWRRQYLSRRYRLYQNYPSGITLRDVCWDLFYLFVPQSPWWYRSLFPGRKGMVTGDFSPTYSFLTRTEIERIAAHYPEMKVLITLREPVERIWSEAKMTLLTPGKSLDQETLMARFAALSNQYHYAAMVDNWKAFFKEEHVKVLYYDQLQADPKGFLTDVCDFIGVDAAPVLNSPKIGIPIFKGAELKLAPELEKQLLAMNEKNLMDWARYSGNKYAAAWAERTMTLNQTT